MTYRPWLLMLATTATAVHGLAVTFQNACSKPVALYDNHGEVPMVPGASTTRDLPNGFKGMFRDGRNDQATLAEFSVDPSGLVWYDISIIPPGPGHCKSADDCKRFTGKTGFNTAMEMRPTRNIGMNTCQPLVCMADGCPDAYQYPSDDTKTHNCPAGTDFMVTFCPGGSGGATQPPAAPTPDPETPVPTTEAPTPAPTPETLAISPEEESSANVSSSSGSLDGSVGDNLDIEAGDAEFGSADSQSASQSSSAPQEEPTPAPIAPPAKDPKAYETSTQSGSGKTTTIGVIVVLCLIASAIVAVIVIAAVREKKKQLDMEAKSPQHSYDASILITTP